MWAGCGLLAATLAVQCASGVRARPVGLTGAIVLLVAATAVAFTAGRYGAGRAAGALGGAFAVGYAAEWTGVRTGVPFGQYRYTGVLQPQVGDVPVAVALAWAGMGLAAYAVATAITGPAARSGAARAWRLLAGAAALTAWDLFLDPQMLRLGLWEWARPGPYRGVPLTNFAGWLVVSLLLMAVIDRVLADRGRPPAGLVTVYTAMAVMEMVAFALVFRPTDPLVAAVGGVAMGVPAALAWARLAGSAPVGRRR
ncbi:carotenoid biosynthesis protein [Actinomadura kijaniata]|uniref:carotenoid biosynthesis protein n=1 Tax=Actinomadura kijaniata TaxID=46161 RepID=UPI003F1CBC39